MDAGYSYVIDVLDVVAHQFGGDDGFFGYGDVAGSGGDYHDHAFAMLLAVALENDGSCQRTEFCLGYGGGYGGVLVFGGTGGQDIAALGC